MGPLRDESEQVTQSAFSEGIEFEETFADAAQTSTAEREPAPLPRLHLVSDETEAAEATPPPAGPSPHTVNEDRFARRIEEMLREWQTRFEERLEQRRMDEERLLERRRLSEEERLRAWRSELEQAMLARIAERQPGDRAPLPDRSGEIRASVRAALRDTASVRDVGRLLRDLFAELTSTSAIALSVHHPERDEVAYRYRVASEDELGGLLRRETLDDGPESAAAHMDDWAHAHRTVRVGARNVVIHTAQCAVRVGDSTIGVLTLQTERDRIGEAGLSHVTEVVALVGPRLAELRDAGRYRGA